MEFSTEAPIYFYLSVLPKENGYELPNIAKQVWFTSSDLTENMPRNTGDHIAAKEANSQPHFLFSSFCTLGERFVSVGSFPTEVELVGISREQQRKED